jgi:D-beta-D-heptose 7-phosphate kinase/D-beta-D-heptose 1-phosphate adenosyltransferase
MNTSIKKIVTQFTGKKVLVIGDIMLDRHITGSVSRISPEAPVPVVLEEKSTYCPGGASNVAYNLRSLGAVVAQVGRIGNDFEGQLLKRELKRKGVDTSGIVLDKNICTITKTRVIAQHQQVVRIDRERSQPRIHKDAFGRIQQYIEKHIPHVDAVILSDYGKGLITPDVVNITRQVAEAHDRIVTVDPKVEHFGYYRGFTGITPNKKEAENAIRNIKISEAEGSNLDIRVDLLDTDELVEKAGTQLMKYLKLKSLLLTLGERGMMLFESGKAPHRIQTQAQEVFDVTGAGDTVISTFTLALTSDAGFRLAADLANAAAGIVVGRMGAAAITQEELLQTQKEKK